MTLSEGFLQSVCVLLCFHFKFFYLVFATFGMYSLCLFVAMFFPTTFEMQYNLNNFN